MSESHLPGHGQFQRTGVSCLRSRIAQAGQAQGWSTHRTWCLETRPPGHPEQERRQGTRSPYLPWKQGTDASPNPHSHRKQCSVMAVHDAMSTCNRWKSHKLASSRCPELPQGLTGNPPEKAFSRCTPKTSDLPAFRTTSSINVLTIRFDYSNSKKD